jgi:hypothetical protein
MAGEGQTRSSDEALSAGVDSVTLGLIPAPEMPEEIAAELSTELPELLSGRRWPRLLEGIGRLRPAHGERSRR